MSREEEGGELTRMPRGGEHEPLVGYGGLNAEYGVRGKGSRCSKCLPCCIVVCVLVFIVSFLVAVALAVLIGYNQVDAEFKHIVADEIQLTNGSAATDQFTKPGAPIHMMFYMYNLTNMEDFITNGTKPNLKEIGPFVYRENKTKYNILWNEDETIMRYDQDTSYTYDTSYKGNLDPNTTNITTINLPLLGLLLQLEKIKENPILQLLPDALKQTVEDVLDAVDEVLRTEFKENLFMTRPVHEVIWGYRDELLGFLADSPLGALVPAIPKGGIFSLEEITSTTKPNMIYTGKGDSRRTARFLMWNGQTSINQWGSPFAQMVNGTEAIMFHPGVTKQDKLEFFVSELFRSGYFAFNKTVNEYGIDMYQYRLPAEEMDGKTQDRGFFMDGPRGMLNLSAVYPMNAPVYVSKPHFLDCDEEYFNNITGLTKPDYDLHDAFLDVEPLTGAVLHAAKRLQINVKLDKYDNLPELADLPDVTYLPVLWVDEGGKLNASMATDFKKRIYTPRKAFQYGSIGLAGLLGVVALVCLIVFVIMTIVCIRKRRNNSTLH